MPTSRAVHDEVAALLDYLLTAEIALYVNSVTYDTSRVTWQGPTGSGLDVDPGAPSITSQDYLNWVEQGHYSAVLNDGALLQITYDLAASEVVGHRLAYIPCPFVLDEQLLLTESIGDVVRLCEKPLFEEISLKSPVRFDLDLAAAKPGHPTSHLTINATSCRIACHSPVRLGNFTRFVFSNFYPATWADHSYLRAMPRYGWGQRTLTGEESGAMHVSWQEMSKELLSA